MSKRTKHPGWCCAVLGILACCGQNAKAAEPLRERLTATHYKIAYECYVDNNWEIFTANADGSDKVNLTNTPTQNEHYPQVSPDGTKISFTMDDGEGKDAVRSLWVMDVDGKNRRKIADHAREQFWAPDGKVLGYLPQEYPRFNVIDYYTKGMNFYHLDTGQTEPHPNSAKLHHLYNPCFSPDGKWIASTVHAGMGVGHAILLIEAHGNRIINLKIPGCRPCISPDGKHIAWGASDHDLVMAPISLDSENPAVGKWQYVIKDAKNKIYHIDWSPDGKFVSFSRGPDGEGDLSKTGTFQAACEIVGVYAKDWNIYAAAADRTGSLDLDKATGSDVIQLTTNGASNKEPEWFK